MKIISTKRKILIRLTRLFRKIHKTIGIVLFVFFLIIATTGLLLGWKKHSNGYILPKSQKGISTDLKTWLPIDNLHSIAVKVLHDSVSPTLKLDLERIDARPQKGMIKFVFIDHFWGIQLDGTTGKLLQIERRRSDIIENIHDGSIVDYFFETDDEQFKLVYTSIMSISLMVIIISGILLWYFPKYIRNNK